MLNTEDIIRRGTIFKQMEKQFRKGPNEHEDGFIIDHQPPVRMENLKKI